MRTKNTLFPMIVMAIFALSFIGGTVVEAATVDSGSWIHLTPVTRAHEPDIWFKQYVASSASPETFSVWMPDYNEPGWRGIDFNAVEIQYQTSTATGDVAVATAYTFVDSTGYDADAAYDSLQATLSGLDATGLISVWFIDIQ